MTEQPTDFFWESSAAALAHSDVATGTMMGFPCLRVSGAFFASRDHRSGDIIVKLPKHRVEQLIADRGATSLVHPDGDVRWDRLTPSPDHTTCQYKGQACYWTVDGTGHEARILAFAYLAAGA